MKWFWNRIYLAFWIWIPIILAVGIILNTTIDLQFHDTYLVLSFLFIASIVSSFLFISGLGYYLNTGLYINKFLFKGHIRLTFVALVVLSISTFVFRFLTQKQLEGPFVEYQYFDYFILLYICQFLGFALLTIGFAFYLTNLLITLIAKSNKDNVTNN